LIPRNAGHPAWLARALREVGVREGKDDARILQYRTATKLRPWAGTSGPGSPWCADFVGWCLEQEDVASTRSAAAASYAAYGRESGLLPGAIVLFGKRDPDAAGTGHVGFVVAEPVGGMVEVVSGNQADAVTRKLYPTSKVAACRWPVFG
jgi:uncharacterized protein (TIGR02594 family)